MPARARRALPDEMTIFEESHDHAEEYLEALAMLEQEGTARATITEVARRMRIKAPSAVQMLKRLADKGLVRYYAREGVALTAKGRKIGMRMVRNGRLMEAFMTDFLKMPLDIKVAHTVEHGMSDAFADALCTLMAHPVSCPHGYPMPPGACCPTARGR
ncbi:MAG TPA: metal-dependent transcriptional regulator [Candidatus Thermoplasmatota archaeon]|nr:metal-dependent transcriptional regulator [Candidatus Thermoplasmatota archaeon]